MQVFKTKNFARYARRAGIKDADLSAAIARANRGLIDADLGGNVIKQRVARDGQGRSGGHRTLIAYKSHKKAFFIFGFAKNEKDNVDDDELETLKEIGSSLLNLSGQELKSQLESGQLQEVKYGKEI